MESMQSAKPLCVVQWKNFTGARITSRKCFKYSRSNTGTHQAKRLSAALFNNGVSPQK
jgi:hypothetical protein